jgi:hypothetical protein
LALLGCFDEAEPLVERVAHRLFDKARNPGRDAFEPLLDM